MFVFVLQTLWRSLSQFCICGVRLGMSASHARIRLLVPIFLVWLSVLVGPGQAAQILVRSINLIRLFGEIEPGDAGRIEQALLDIGADSYAQSPQIRLIELNSPGGSFLEGIKIARTIRRFNAQTVVRDGDRCYSACAIAFLGGNSLVSDGSPVPSRGIERGGRLGFHAPYLELPAGSAYGSTQVESAYVAAVENISEFMNLADEVDVPVRLSPILLHPDPSSVYLISTIESFVLFRISPQPIVAPPSLTPSLALNACQNYYLGRRGYRRENFFGRYRSDVLADSFFSLDGFVGEASDGAATEFWYSVPDAQRKSKRNELLLGLLAVQYEDDYQSRVRSFIPLHSQGEAGIKGCVIEHVTYKEPVGASSVHLLCTVFDVRNYEGVIAKLESDDIEFESCAGGWSVNPLAEEGEEYEVYHVLAPANLEISQAETYIVSMLQSEVWLSEL